MAFVHVHLTHHTVTPSRQGGQRAVEYLTREGIYAPEHARTQKDAERAIGYLVRTGKAVSARDDLRYQEVFNLPDWAPNAQTFFEASARYEQVSGRWASAMQASLPRALPLDAQIALSRDFMQQVFPGRTMLLVVHEPTASDGQPQPHFHALWSERRNSDGIARGPAQMFQRHVPKYPERSGAPKEVFGKGDRHAPYRLREAWCAAANLALEARGIDDFLDPRSAKARGLSRETVRVVYEKNDKEKLEGRLIDERTPEDRHKEQQLAAQWWQRYKRTMGLDVQHMDHAQVLAMIAREVREPGARAKELDHAHREQVTRDIVTRGPLIGNVRSKIFHVPGDPNYGHVVPGNQVQFWSIEAAEQAGYRQAANRHYGPGSRERLERSIHQLQQEIAQLDQHGKALDIEAMTMRGYERRGVEPPAASIRRADSLLRQMGGMGLEDERRIARTIDRPKLHEPVREEGLDLGR